MAKNKISEYSATAASNTDVANINIAEGCSPSNVNNAIRGVMAHLKDFQAGNVTGNALAIAGGGTGAESASAARTNLGLGSLSTLNTVDTAQIDDDAITTAKITDANITNAKMATDSVDTAQIVDDAVTSAKIAADAVTTTELNVSGTGTSGQALLSDGDGSMSWGSIGIGVNQTWQDVTGSRSFGVTYTNNTGKPIFISVLGLGSPNHGVIQMVIDGISIGQQGVASVASAGMHASMSAIVPNGSTYQVNNVIGASLSIWAELR